MNLPDRVRQLLAATPSSDPPARLDVAVEDRDRVGDAVCVALGVSDSVLLRRTSGTTVLAAGDRVVRLAEPAHSAIDLSRLTALAVQLNRRQVAVTEPLAWFFAGDWEVSVWRRYRSDAEPDFEQLGRVLTGLHTIDPARLGPLPPFADTLDRGRRRIARYEQDVPGLTGAWERRVDHIKGMIGDRVVHGDLNVGNVLWGDEVRLCGLEAVCVGPPEWDLAKLANSLETEGFAPSAFTRVLDGYTLPVRCDVLDACIALDAVKSLTWHLSEADALDAGPSRRAALVQRLAASAA